MPPVENPLMRTAWRIVEAIIEDRMDPCRGAHKLYWMASVPVEDPVHIELAGGVARRLQSSRMNLNSFR